MIIKDRDDRDNVEHLVAELDTKISSLRIRYEQYFAGVEKRAPLREQEAIARELRQLNQRKIMQTELRYKFQNLASRFHVYQGMWERIQREIDEGRYHRHVQKKAAKAALATGEHTPNEVEQVYQEYQTICQNSNANLPSRQQLEKFINQQKENIRSKYGNVQCQFHVTCENGKPKIKVNLKR